MNADIKVLQKHVNARVKDGKSEIRCATRYKDDAQVFDVFERKRMEQRAALKAQEETKDAMEADVQNLNEIVKKQEIEKIRLKQQFARLTKKMALQENCLQKEHVTVNESDKDLYKKHVLTDILKEATGLYKVDTSEPNSIRGFTYNRFNVVTPFDIDTNVCTVNEVKEQVYDVMKWTSPYNEEWEEIFSK